MGAYIKETLTFKRRSDIEAKEPDLEHLWIEFPGRNKHSKLLLGTMSRSEKMLTSAEWLERFENPLGYLTATWDGLIVVAGDINIDLLGPNKPITSGQYLVLINRAGGLYGRILTEVASTDRTQ